jgi:hypothetical protein
VDCECGLRNNYFEGKRLTADSFRVEQKYMIGRRYLLNRAIHGWGVVYGYKISSGAPDTPIGPGKLKIGPGLALDICGRELVQTERPIAVGDVIVRDENDEPLDLDTLTPADFEERCWLLSVHYAQQPIDHVRVEDPCRCEHDEWDHICETVRYSLRPIPCEECCQPFDCELECDCATGPCCDEPEIDQKVIPDNIRPKQSLHRSDLIPGYDYGNRPDAESINTGTDKPGYVVDPIPPPRKPPTKRHPRGGCQCLCDHLTNLPMPDHFSLCEIEEPCGNVWVDLKNGVPLACVDLVRDDCDRWTFGDVEACGPRRLVKRNDLLFDLIRGCDLTYIKDYGWKNWHRRSTPVPFQAFADAIATGGDADDSEYISRDFWVEFSRPVRRETVQQDCFVMTVISLEGHDHWWNTLRVPIVRVEMPAGDLIERATIVVDGTWVRGAVRGDSSIFENQITRIEFEVRGDFIVDCNDQTIDANAHGRSIGRTGNGTPGDSFLSTFLVGAPSPVSVRRSEERSKGVS